MADEAEGVVRRETEAVEFGADAEPEVATVLQFAEESGGQFTGVVHLRGVDALREVRLGVGNEPVAAFLLRGTLPWEVPPPVPVEASTAQTGQKRCGGRVTIGQYGGHHSFLFSATGGFRLARDVRNANDAFPYLQPQIRARYPYSFRTVGPLGHRERGPIRVVKHRGCRGEYLGSTFAVR